MDAGDYVALPAADDVAAHLFPTLRRGAPDPDVTLVSYGGMLAVVEAAARRLTDAEELAVEIVAPSLLSPLPRGSLIRHLATRRRVVIVEESHHDFGVSAEIAAAMLEAGSRRAAAHRHAAGADRVRPSLERSIIPDEESSSRRFSICSRRMTTPTSLRSCPPRGRSAALGGPAAAEMAAPQTAPCVNINDEFVQVVSVNVGRAIS